MGADVQHGAASPLERLEHADQGWHGLQAFELQRIQPSNGLFILPSSHVERFFPLQRQSHTVLLGKPNEKRHQGPVGNLQRTSWHDKALAEYLNTGKYGGVSHCRVRGVKDLRESQ